MINFRKAASKRIHLIFYPFWPLVFCQKMPSPLSTMAWVGGESCSLCPFANSRRWWILIAWQLRWESTGDWHQRVGIWREVCQWKRACCLHLSATYSLQVPGNFPRHPDALKIIEIAWLDVGFPGLQKGQEEREPTICFSCASPPDLGLVLLLSRAGHPTDLRGRFQMCYCLGSELVGGGGNEEMSKYS